MAQGVFGEHQDIAVTACQRMRSVVEAPAASVAGIPEGLERTREGLRRWARDNPLEPTFSTRESAATLLADLLSGDSRDVFDALGDLSGTLHGLSLRLNTYAEHLPRQARWQAEHLLDEVEGREQIAMLLDNVDRVAAAAERTDALISDIPGVARDAAEPVGVLVNPRRFTAVSDCSWSHRTKVSLRCR